jgi:hypothetical protein
MPTLASVLEALPFCPDTAQRSGPISNIRNTRPCTQRLRYQPADNVWSCPAHGVVWTGAALVLARAGYAVVDGEVLAA